MYPEILKANDFAMSRMMDARPFLVGMGKALDVIPGMRKNLLLHAGPPISWERASGPLKGAVTGALLFEGLAKNLQEADALMKSGQVSLEPCHDHQAVGPMAGVISPSMSVYIVEDKNTSIRAYSNMSDNRVAGRGASLRFGVFSNEVIAHLHWMEEVLASTLSRALKACNGIDLRALICEALHMGDECHSRVRATSLLLMKSLAPWVAKVATSIEDTAKILELMGDDQFFGLNATMASCKVMSLAASGVEKSSIVTIMARNGTDFGIKVSGLGNAWFTAPAPVPRGLLFPGFKPEDTNPDIGDSAITETVGLGGLAVAAAPAVISFIGGTAQDAYLSTMEKFEITHMEHKHFTMPTLDFRGTPAGIDLIKVVEKNIRPTINTGMANREMGKTMVGCGSLEAPANVFEKALEAFVAGYVKGAGKTKAESAEQQEQVSL